MKNPTTGFISPVPIPPGETIRDEMEYFGMSQKELAERLGMSAKHVSEILSGDAPITRDCAFKLSMVFDQPMEFWMNLETNYQVSKSKLEQEKYLSESLEFLPLFKSSLTEIRKRVLNIKVLPRNEIEQVKILCHFFGVSSLSKVFTTERIAYRKRDDEDKACIATWLRIGEIRVKDQELDEYNPKRLRSSLSNLRSLTLKGKYIDNLETIREILNSAGVYFEYEPKVPKAKVVGATRWRKGRPFIQMSDFGKFQDVFWFTLFHEIGHALLHGKKDFSLKEGELDAKDFVFMDENDNRKKEDEANRFAQETLIPKEAWDKFHQEHTIGNRLSITTQDVEDLAQNIGITPCIVAGRLGKEYDCWPQVSSLRT